MGEVIVITSGKGGVGKTTVAANIGACLSLLGKNVIIIDTDLGLRNLDVVMGLENQIVYNLVDVVDGTCRVKQAAIKDKRFPHLYMLPSAQTKDKNAVTPNQMEKLCRELKSKFDYVIIDCPAGIEQGFNNAIAGADKAIIVTTPEVSAIRDADRVSGLLESHGIKDTKLIVNKVRDELIKKGDMMSPEDVMDILGLDIIGTIKDDVSVVISTNRGEMLSGTKTKAGISFMNICKIITGENIQMPKVYTKRKFSLFSKKKHK